MAKNQHATKVNSLKKFLRVMTVYQKLGVILESKVVQRLSLEKKCFIKYVIFSDNFFFLKKIV